MKNTFTTLTRTLAIAVITMLGTAAPVLADHERGYKQHGNKYRQGGQCTFYEISSRGGAGGIRFMHNIPDYLVVRNGTRQGKICRDGYVTVELSKLHPSTHVALKINGQHYVFGRGEYADKYANNWHRKYVKIALSRHRGQRPWVGSNERQYNGHDSYAYQYYGQNHGQNYGYRHGQKRKSQHPRSNYHW